MKIQIITLFPEMFQGVFEHSMLWKAQEKKLAQIELINLRDFGSGPRKTVDDTPYGGGDGMVLKAEPIAKAIGSAKQSAVSNQQKVILLTPRGERLRQPKVEQLAKVENLIIICGRYEGYDERVVSLVDEQISVGDFVLTGGEIPAMTLVDAVVRLIPGVLGGETSAANESFSDGESLEYPQYTRPEVWRDQKVPEVLLSGNHAEVAKWRTEQSAKTTQERQSERT